MTELEIVSLPGLGHHNDRGFGVFACPHPRFRELDFCTPKTGSSTITLKDVDRQLTDLTTMLKYSKRLKGKETKKIEEVVVKEIIEIIPTKQDDNTESQRKDDEDKEEEEDMSALDIFKKVEKPTFNTSQSSHSKSDEEFEASSESGSIPDAEKLGPKTSYTPQIETEESEMKSAEVGAEGRLIFTSLWSKKAILPYICLI